MEEINRMIFRDLTKESIKFKNDEYFKINLRNVIETLLDKIEKLEKRIKSLEYERY